MERWKSVYSPALRITWRMNTLLKNPTKTSSFSTFCRSGTTVIKNDWNLAALPVRRAWWALNKLMSHELLRVGYVLIRWLLLYAFVQLKINIIFSVTAWFYWHNFRRSYVPPLRMFSDASDYCLLCEGHTGLLICFHTPLIQEDLY